MPSVQQQVNRDDDNNLNGEIGDEGSQPAVINGHSDAYDDEDAFQHLPKPQQDVLLLHGPRQKYALQKNGCIPELRSEREILVQVRIAFSSWT